MSISTPISRKPRQSSQKRGGKFTTVEAEEPEDLKVIKFDLAQSQETLNVKNEQIRNLQNQLEAQKRRIQ